MAGKRAEREAIKRAKMAMSVAALTITVGGWLSLHASESADRQSTPAQAVSAPQPGTQPAPFTTTRSSK